MKFEYKNTRERRHAPVKFNLSIRHDDHGPPQSIGVEMFQEKYVMSLTANVEFWSNTAQFEGKAAHAEKVLRSHLFKEMLPIVEELLMNANSEETYLSASRLKKMMIDGEDPND